MSAHEETAPSVGPDATVTRGRTAEQLHPVARLPEEWRAYLEARGERGFRAQQLFRWIHARGVLDAAQMTDLSKALREELQRSGLSEPGQVAQVHESRDGTRKLVLGLAHGARVECVLIPMTPLAELDADASASADDGVPEAGSAEDTSDDAGEALLPAGEGDKDRVTLCVSTQFGCAMGCVFCASGQAGLFRGLGAAEVVYQVLVARRYLRPREELKNLVFMGMGEPLHHYDETARSIRLLTHPEGGGMSPRRITVSTVGLVPGIRRLGEDFGGKVGLAISLHAPDDETRSRILPMNRRYPIAELMDALRQYPLPPRRRITIEYTLIGGVNDSPEHAARLARLLRPLRVKVNLIPMNSIDASELRAPTAERVAAFREYLAGEGYSCFVRTRRGDDVSAACGQLAMREAQVPEKSLVRRDPRDRSEIE
jgi:23S rRNA (adenine2503-C2)-methyltransferase